MPHIPSLAGPYRHIYAPLGDTFAGPDGPSLKTGQYYADWVPNDHTFVRARDGRWHAFGITGPDSPHIHEAEWQAFHIVSPGVDFDTEQRWEERPKVLCPAERPSERKELWAPFVIECGGLYHMFYGPLEMRRAVSEDLVKWEPRGPVFAQDGHARDPWVHVVDGEYHMIYMAGDSVYLRRSADCVTWSPDPVKVFSTHRKGAPESPVVVAHEGLFHLFWTIHDGTHGNYDHRTYVMCSERPDRFEDTKPICMLDAHAPELVRLDDGRWFISSVEWPKRGVSIAPLTWEKT